MILPFQSLTFSTEFRLNFHAFFKTLSEATFLHLQAAPERENVAVLNLFDIFWAALEFSAPPKSSQNDPKSGKCLPFAALRVARCTLTDH